MAIFFSGLNGLDAQACPAVVNTAPSPCQLYPLPNGVLTFTNVTTSTLSVLNYTGISIRIVGTLTVNKSIVFSNCKVRIDPGGSIVTSGSAGLYANSGTYLYSCGQWNGITVNSAGIIKLTNSFISDAVTAVRLLPGFSAVPSQIAGNTFFRNTTDISVGNINGPATTLALSQFYGNTFDGRVPNTSTSVQPQAILLNNVTGYMTGTLGMNTISNHQIGINANLSNITVSNTKFQNFTSGGRGILAGNSVVRNTGTVGGNACIYNNICNGVDIDGTNCELNIANTTHTGAYNFGILSRLGPSLAGNLTVINSNIFTTPIGGDVIKCIQTERGNHVMPGNQHLIRSNTFNIINNSDYPGKQGGILVSDMSSVRAEDYYSVDRNRINVTNGSDAILINGKTGEMSNECLNFFIQYDTVYSVGNIIGTGPFPIAVKDVDGDGMSISTRIEENIVQSPETDVNNGYCGIHIERSRANSVCGNNVNGNVRGFHFNGDCDLTSFGQNTIGNNQVGLHIEQICNPTTPPEPTIIGDQVRTQNMWELAAYTSGNLNSLCFYPQGLGQWAARFDGGNESQSRFFVPTSDFATLPTDITPPSGWFFFQPGALNPCVQTVASTQAARVSEEDLAIADHPVGSGTQNAADWGQEVSLLKRLQEHPSMQGEPKLKKFQDAHHQKNTSAWRFAKADFEVAQSVKIQDAHYQPLAKWQAELIRLYQIADSLSALAGTAENPEALNGRLVGILTQIEAKETLKRKQIEQISGMQAVKMKAVWHLLEELPEATDYEYNQKFIHQWYARQVKGDTIDAIQQNTLRVVAAKDPGTGGLAVLEARRLLPAAEQTKYPMSVNHDHESHEAFKRSVSAVATTVLPTWHLAPNPTEQNITLNGQWTAPLFWQITDCFGRSIASGTTQEGGTAQSLETTGLMPGVYYLSARSGEQKVTLRFIKL